METSRLFCFWTLLTIAVVPRVAYGQLSQFVVEPRPPQAQTRQELKAYLDVVQDDDPAQTIRLISRFVQQFPKSEFLSQLYRRKMHAHRSLNDYKKMIQAGEKVLETNPFDVDALLTLAAFLPNQDADSKDYEGVLDKAENYARRVLEEIATLKAARTLPLADWLALLQRSRASAHESLGVVAFSRRKYAESVTQFELCTRENPAAEGSQFYRLGIAYRYIGKKEQAMTAFKRAIDLGPEAVMAKAKEQLFELQE
jgi:tetratricopeptide (TPR) repeat protein